MYHKIVLIGRLGRDPEMRYTPGGAAVTNFSLATTSKLSKSSTSDCPNGWKESYDGKNWELTTWFRVTVWRNLAEAVNQYLEKGSQVFVEGELRGEACDGSQNPRIWTGNDGLAKASYEVTARTVKFLGKRDNGGAPVGAPPVGGEDDDVLPF